MATNKELEAQVSALREEVETLSQKLEQAEAQPDREQPSEEQSEAIPIIGEILLELIETTRSINVNHPRVMILADKLEPYIPKKGG